MFRDQGKRLPQCVDVRSFSRPMKVVFLVPVKETDLSHWVLDAIFHEAYSRWGGARSLIVPFNDEGVLDTSYDHWISVFDPDFVYSYVDLEPDYIQKLNQSSLPIALIRHKVHEPNRWRDYIPDWSPYIKPVGSISTLTSPYNNYPGWSQVPTPHVYVKQYEDNCKARFLPDNFAVSLSTHSHSNGQHGVYETICYTPDDVSERFIVGTYRCNSLIEMINKMANKEARFYSKLSSLHTKGLILPNDHKWSNFFHIVIGDSVLDRINFWNIRHFCSGMSTDGAPSSLIISPSLIEDDAFCKSVGSFLNNHNFLGSNNGPHLAYVTSYSLDRDTCSGLLTKLQGERNTWNHLAIPMHFSELAVPNSDEYKTFNLNHNESFHSNALHERDTLLSAKEPDHFKYLPNNFLHAKRGQWIVDCKVEANSDVSYISNSYYDWKLPRRLETVKAFSKNIGKINTHGGLSLIPSTDRHFSVFEEDGDYKLQLSLPNNETIFSYLVIGNSSRKQYYDYRECLNRDRYYHIQISDKGQNHRGIVTKFRSVTEAANILANRYWRGILRECMSRPDRDYSLRQLEGHIQKLDVSDLERIRCSFHFKNTNMVKPYLKHNLSDAVELLVHNGILHQFHDWRCQYCGSHNKRGLGTLRLLNHCDVCEREYNCPIDFEWRYSPSKFVVDTLAVRNGLTVLWVISHLIATSWQSRSIYLPEVDLFKDTDARSKNEIDILAIIDGKYMAGEVKLTASAFCDNEREVVNFIDEINLLQPDVAVLAFEMYCTDKNNTDHMRNRLEETFRAIRTSIRDDINLVKIVAEDIPEFFNFPEEIGPSGHRTYAFLDKQTS